MKTKHLKARAKQILVQIHRGFLTKEDSEKLTDSQILDSVPKHSLSPKYKGDSSHLVTSPFTFKWVMNALKKDSTVTSYDLLVLAGFKEEGMGA